MSKVLNNLLKTIQIMNENTGCGAKGYPTNPDYLKRAYCDKTKCVDCLFKWRRSDLNPITTMYKDMNNGYKDTSTDSIS